MDLCTFTFPANGNEKGCLHCNCSSSTIAPLAIADIFPQLQHVLTATGWNIILEVPVVRNAPLIAGAWFHNEHLKTSHEHLKTSHKQQQLPLALATW